MLKDFNTIEFVDWDTDKVEEYSKHLYTIFQYNEDLDKTAYLNWRMDSRRSDRHKFVIMGEAYFSTAYALIQICLEDNSDKKADVWIFPILFNIVHGIEVYLKAINVVLNVVLNKPRVTIQGGHDIKQLCSIAKHLLIEYRDLDINETKKQMYAALKAVERFIANIYEKTGDMTFARYPITDRNEDHFYVKALQNEVVDLELLEEQMVVIYNSLDFIYEMPELEMELYAEMMSDMMVY